MVKMSARIKICMAVYILVFVMYRYRLFDAVENAKDT